MNPPARPADPSPVAPPGSPLLLGGVVALVVARPLMGGADPARLHLTSGAGPLTHQLLCLILATLYAAGQVRSSRPVRVGSQVLAWLGALLLTLACATLLCASDPHPAGYLLWDLLSLAALGWLVTQLAGTPGASFSLLLVLLAVGVSVAAQGVYQAARTPLQWPELERIAPPTADLVGDFTAPADPLARFPRGPFDRPETLACFLLLLLPLVMYVGHVGWWQQQTPRGRARTFLVLTVLVGLWVAGTAWFSAGLTPPRLSWPDGTERWLGEPGRFHASTAANMSAVERLLDQVGIVGLLSAAGGLALLAFALLKRPAPELPPLRDSAADRNTLFAGAVAGSLLGFVGATGNLGAEAPPVELLNLGVVAGVRSLILFASLALLQNCVLRRDRVVQCLAAGAGLVLLAGLLTDRVLLGAVALPLVVALAVGWNLRRGEAIEQRPRPLAGAVAALAALVLVAWHFVDAAQPAWKTAAAVRDARAASRLVADMLADLEPLSGPRRLLATQKFEAFLRGNVLNPLRAACKADPGNAALLTETARWLRREWDVCLRLPDEKRTPELTREMLLLHDAAVRLAPRDPRMLEEQRETLLYVLSESRTLRKERGALLDRNLAQTAERFPDREFPARERALEALLQLYLRPNVKAAEGEREWLREQIETQAIRLFELDAEHSRWSDLRRRAWVERLTIALLAPRPELKRWLGGE